MIRKNMHLLAISMLMLNVAGIGASGLDGVVFHEVHYANSNNDACGNPIDLFIAEIENIKEKTARKFFEYRLAIFSKANPALEKELEGRLCFAARALTVCQKWKLTPDDCEAGIACCYDIKLLRAAQAAQKN